jgi:hypothetical protein
MFLGQSVSSNCWLPINQAFTKHTNSPRAYLIRRNRPVAEKIISDALSSNPEATIHFIPADCFLLKEVSRVCQEIKRKEDEISGSGKGAVNLLVLSQSSSGLDGRSGKVAQLIVPNSL